MISTYSIINFTSFKIDHSNYKPNNYIILKKNANKKFKNRVVMTLTCV